MKSKALPVMLALLLCSCKGADAANGRMVEDNGCPAHLDSATLDAGMRVRSCRELFERRAPELRSVRVVRSGYVTDTVRHVYDQAKIRWNGRGELGRDPIRLLYENLLGGLCEGDSMPAGKSCCLDLESSEFLPEKGIPLRVRTEIRTAPGIDCDAVTRWEVDSLIWK